MGSTSSPMMMHCRGLPREPVKYRSYVAAAGGMAAGGGAAELRRPESVCGRDVGQLPSQLHSLLSCSEYADWGSVDFLWVLLADEFVIARG